MIQEYFNFNLNLLIVSLKINNKYNFNKLDYKINLFEIVEYYGVWQMQAMSYNISYATKYLSMVESDTLTYINFWSNFYSIK